MFQQNGDTSTAGAELRLIGPTIAARRQFGRRHASRWFQRTTVTTCGARRCETRLLDHGHAHFVAVTRRRRVAPQTVGKAAPEIRALGFAVVANARIAQGVVEMRCFFDVGCGRWMGRVQADR